MKKEIEQVFSDLQNALFKQIELSHEEDEIKKKRGVLRSEILRLRGELQEITKECLLIQ